MDFKRIFKLIFRTFISSSLLLTSLSAQSGIQTDKWYRIKPLGDDDKCYDVCNGSQEDCAKVILYKQCNESKNQQFKFEVAPRNRSAFLIHPRHAPQKVLDISEGSEENGAGLIQYHYITNRYNPNFKHDNQEFYVSRIGGDLYRITNVKSGLSLGFDEDDDICQYLDFGPDSIVKLEEVDY